MSSSVAVVSSVEVVEGTEPARAAWSLPRKIVFRVVFLYLMLYMFFNGNVTIFTPLEVFPTIDKPVATALAQPFALLTQWWAVRLLHLTGMAATWHRDGSGDTLLNYLLCVTFLVLALVGAAVWSAVDRRRANYDTLYAWLRFLVRLNVGIGMLQYGFYKVYPVQMQPPNMAVLNEPLGQSSPMTLLWTLLGLVPLYERVCGLAEVAGGLLILVRRTALAGAMLSAFVMTNVVLYNLFFDVPVKLYAIHLLAMSCFVMLPDMKPLWEFFVMHRSTRPQGVWAPPAVSARGRRAVAGFEIAYMVLSVWALAAYDGGRYKAYLASAEKPSPIRGLWELDAGQPMPMMFGGGHWHSISIDNLSRGMARSTDGMLMRMYLTYDEAQHRLRMTSRGGGAPVTYTWQTPDADHMVLTTAGVSMAFHRVPTPQNYPLLTRGFHMINEWGYER